MCLQFLRLLQSPSSLITHTLSSLSSASSVQGSARQLVSWTESVIHSFCLLSWKLGTAFHIDSSSLSLFGSVQLLSGVRLFATRQTTADQASLYINNSRSPPKPISIELVMPSNHLILCCPLLLLPSIFPGIRVFSNESAFCIRWPKYWSFSFNISPSNEHAGLISFRMDWVDLLAVQGTLKTLLQHQSSKETLMYRTVLWTLRERERVGRFGRMALKRVKYHV